MKHPCGIYARAGFDYDEAKATRPTIWRSDDTCSYCGCLMPSVALRLIERGAPIIRHGMTTFYIGNLRRKVSLHHFNREESEQFKKLICEPA